MHIPAKSVILVVNAGSSSVKFTLFRIEDEAVLATGMVERIGLSGTRLVYTSHKDEERTRAVPVQTAREAVLLIIQQLMDADQGILPNKDALAGIGHRVVHGGDQIHQSVIIDEPIKKIIQDCFALAPLHNPPNLEGIDACQSLFPDLPLVAVFDTAFHATLPEHAYLYGLPYKFYENGKIRRYGFHGTSHAYVSQEAAGYLGSPLESLKLITCHLGNGSSITAVKHSHSIDTSMGFTPLEGTVMGTRCGSIDPAVVMHLMRHHQMTIDQIDNLLNQKSGFHGLADIGSSDARDVITAMDQGNKQAAAAINLYVYQIRKYIGAYIAAMNGLDAIVFTAGIGENSARIRDLICNGGNGLQQLGIHLDTSKNETVAGTSAEIQSNSSPVKLLVIPTNEALEIARQTIALL
jgi:acetate kinase